MVFTYGMSRHPRGIAWPAVLLAALLAWSAHAGGDQARPGVISAAEHRFIDRHWQRPLPPQGPPPARFTPIERSLEPQSCGTCHPQQLADWRTSLHAGSMGPGVTGQLVEFRRTDPDMARLCLSCHAPLAEQEEDPGFAEQGLVCATCHVRHHERFGPPRRDGSTESTAPPESLPHGGATRTGAFLRSEFCASCHQFEPDGFALNDKLLENTYEEWKASQAARRGQQCQDCHMPDRRHLWRGIHDPEMVKSGVTITLTTDRTRYRPGQSLLATLTIANTGVGHHFPTYVTPRVVARAELLDASGRAVPGSAEERIIAREVALDLTREVFDTRIPAGERFVFRYRQRVPGPGTRLRVTVTVLPDHFYTGFFESLLRTGAGAGEPLIREALENTRRSRFTLYEKEITLG